MVTNSTCSKIIVHDDEECDRLRGVLRRLDRVREQLLSVDAAIDTDYFHLRRDAGLKRRTPDDSVGHNPVQADLEADGVDIARIAAASLQLQRLVIEQDFPAAVFDASHGCCRGSGGQPGAKESGP